MWIVFALGGAVFVAVATFTAYYAWRYRHRGARGEPPQIFGNAREEVLWMVGAAALLAGLFALAWWTMNRVDPAPPAGRTPDVIVTGHQWYWEAAYPAAGGRGAVRVANEVHIPAGQRLLVELRSADVIHDLWLPRLGRKMDAVPGQSNWLWLEADRPGRYGGTCAEFCGAQHAWMRLDVVADAPDAFGAWLAAQARSAAPPSVAAAQAGAALFAREGCGTCHALRGVGARGGPGPDLTHFASRQIIAGGVLTNTPANLRTWLRAPQAVKPGTRMPTYPLTDADLGHLGAYLGGLK